MRKFKNLLMVVVLCTSATIFAQTKLTGKVVDETSQPLPGASIVVKGSSTGVSTDFDGNFTLETSISNGTIVVSFVGYEAKNLTFNWSKNFGSIALNPSAESLEEIIITATSFAIDRKTPVAVSTVKAEVIENKLGSQEFPEILKSTPGVYATKSGGGFGDGRLNLRGFNSENVAVMINGVPVNDMESGRVYWSNWAGLSDVTGAMQVQRGLGASKVAVPSIGGTINILSKTTDSEAGGSAGTSFGNDNYFKIGATVSTGLLESGLAATISAAKTTGDGYIDGTEFEGANYFVNLSYIINDNHKLSLTSFGAPQSHGQRQYKNTTIEGFRNAESGTKFNPDWGLRGGKVVHVDDNFYHKNQTSLNHYWNINDNSNLSTAVYASWGNGGGSSRGGDDKSLFNIRLGGDDQPIDIDNIVAINRANGEQGLGTENYLKAGFNNHSWYGLLSTFDTALGENFKLIGGLDLRTYTGYHYTKVTDLLGGAYAFDDNDANRPNNAAKVGDIIDYNNDGEVGWQGLFGQLEYDKDRWSIFTSLSASNTSYVRVDNFLLDSDPLRETEKSNFFGYSAKGGANYRINDLHNVFANIGYFEKAPSFRAFENGQHDNALVNPDANNETVFSVELGYGLRSEKFAANVNVYRTAWNDRFLSKSFTAQSGERFNASILGVNALHQGIEVDFTYRPNEKLNFYGMLSLGDWQWDSNLENVPVFDEEQNEVGNVSLFIEGLKVSDAAQTTAAIGMNWEVMDKTFFTVDYNYFADLYADFDPNDRGAPGPQAWEVPNYSTVDASIRYGFKIGDLDTVITGRMNNVFNTEYIADADDGAGSVANTALVWYGYGRTFNVSAKIKF
jgi:outer membrane cobalamin receptor